MKFWCASDVYSKYFLTGFSDLGKDDIPPNDMSLYDDVLRSVESLTREGGNVTVVNYYFTSFSLARKKTEKEKN